MKSPPNISNGVRISLQKRTDIITTIGVYSMPVMVIVVVSVSDKAFMKKVSETTMPNRELINNNGIESVAKEGIILAEIP